MLILSLRTDKPEAEVGLYKDNHQIAYLKWMADRQLAETIHVRIKQLLENNQLTYHDLQAVLAYKGPGSFTGLRIGLSVANALSYGLSIPIVGNTGETWLDLGITRILSGDNDKMVIPEYGSEPHVTRPKH